MKRANMMTTKLIITSLLSFSAFNTFAQSNRCDASGGPFIVNSNKFLGSGQNAENPRPLFAVLPLPNSIAEQDVVNSMSIQVGRYLFVPKKDGSWTRYRQDDPVCSLAQAGQCSPMGAYRLFDSTQNSIKVTTDANIYVKKEEHNTLSIRRNSSSEDLTPEIKVRVGTDSIEVLDGKKRNVKLAQVDFVTRPIGLSNNSVAVDLNKSLEANLITRTCLSFNADSSSSPPKVSQPAPSNPRRRGADGIRF